MKLDQLERHGILGRRKARMATAQGEKSEDSLASATDNVALDFVLEDIIYDSSRSHGRHIPYDVQGLHPAAFSVACKDDTLKDARLSNAVYLDTETTGLGLGTGTYAFLVGAGFWSEDGFAVRQFFLTGPQYEPAFLTRLTEFLDRFDVIVSFNGRAFDWPLLENRFVLHRARIPLASAPHLDLLHVARRLWKRRLVSCSLGSLESHVLQVYRTEEDVPGYLIPEMYFRYVQSGDAEPLRRVFYHNAQDILSLATLALHVQSVIETPELAPVDMPEDWLSLGRLLERTGNEGRACACFERAAESGLRSMAACEALLSLARLHKRARRWDAAVMIWARLANSSGSASLAARIELAKYYEHVERDYMRAIGHVQHALDLSDLFSANSSLPTKRDLDLRLARLVKRSLLERGRVSRAH